MTKYLKQQTWIVVPAYNEEKYIGQVLKKILQYSQQVIVIDDGSSDGTTEIVQQFPVHSLKHRINLGKGAALKTACEYAFDVLKAEAIIMLDADDQHDPHELPLFYDQLAKGHQVIFGVRDEPKNMPWIKLKMNRLNSYLNYLLFGKYILDIPSGYKAFTKQAYEKIAWEASNYSVELEIAAKTAYYKLPFTTVGIKTIYHDMSKGMTMLDTIDLVMHMIYLKVSL